MVQSATKAADYPGCVDLKPTQSRDVTARGVIRSLGTAPGGSRTRSHSQDRRRYQPRRGIEAAAVHLPAHAVRPAFVLFPDDKHDVPVPCERACGSRWTVRSRTALALLPSASAWTRRASALEEARRPRIVRDMPPCVPGAVFISRRSSSIRTRPATRRRCVAGRQLHVDRRRIPDACRSRRRQGAPVRVRPSTGLLATPRSRSRRRRRLGRVADRGLRVRSRVGEASGRSRRRDLPGHVGHDRGLDNGAAYR